MKQDIIVYTLVAVLILGFGLVGIKNIRAATSSGIISAVDDVRSVYGFPALTKDPILTSFAVEFSQALAQSSAEHAAGGLGLVATPPLSSEYPAIRFDQMSVNTDGHWLGMTNRQVVEELMRDQKQSESIRNSLLKDVGVGIIRKLDGNYVITVILAEKI